MLALFAMLLVATASTVQACHAHGELPGLRGKSNAASAVPLDGRSSTPAPGPADRPATPEDHCALCVAMHSALPSSLHVELNQLVTLARVSSTAAEAERIFRWRFELFSRPPPAIA